MRLSSINPPLPKPAVTPAHTLSYRMANPYHTWLQTLCVGAAIACLAFLVEAIFNFAQLSSRMRGVPGQNFVRTVYPFVLLGVASSSWIAIWLLTSDDPSPHAPRRVRAWLLRGLATVTVLFVFMYVLRMLDAWRLRTTTVFTILNSLELLTTIFFWLHMRSIARKLDFRGSRWRATVAMIGTCATIALLHIGPRASVEVRGLLSITNFQLTNLRWAMTVLWAVISALVVLRFALGFANEIRLDRKSRTSASA
jgi:hypothetical protein